MIKDKVAKTQTHKNLILIEGITEDGAPFRPSDWAERMCGSLASFNNRRIVYSPHLRPIIKSNKGHIKCLVVDPTLQETNPDIFECVMKFAGENRLKIHTSYSEQPE